MRRSEIELRCPICRLGAHGVASVLCCVHGFDRWCRHCGHRCPHGRWHLWRPCPDCANDDDPTDSAGGGGGANGPEPARPTPDGAHDD
eukprot:1629048-Lingulodinium_polyedra.AAC.1